MQTIATTCKSCEKYSLVSFRENEELACPVCQAKWGSAQFEKDVFETCLHCECRHFYKHRDFNRALGCFIMLIGIVLVPFTFGLSLPVLALIDWILYQRTKDVITCYRCGMEYRGFTPPAHINGFEHHLGDKFQEKNNS